MGLKFLAFVSTVLSARSQKCHALLDSQTLSLSLSGASNSAIDLTSAMSMTTTSRTKRRKIHLLLKELREEHLLSGDEEIVALDNYSKHYRFSTYRKEAGTPYSNQLFSVYGFTRLPSLKPRAWSLEDDYLIPAAGRQIALGRVRTFFGNVVSRDFDERKLRGLPAQMLIPWKPIKGAAAQLPFVSADLLPDNVGSNDGLDAVLQHVLDDRRTRNLPAATALLRVDQNLVVRIIPSYYKHPEQQLRRRFLVLFGVFHLLMHACALVYRSLLPDCIGPMLRFVHGDVAVLRKLRHAQLQPLFLYMEWAADHVWLVPSEAER